MKERRGNAVVFSEDEFDALYGDVVKIHRAVKDRAGIDVEQELERVVVRLLCKKARAGAYQQAVID